ncbi:Uncharacterised protein [Moraxella lacunata]|uniref:Uncharacterized protein n=1 Tax=Moraxella lacunata TaxID=477 RepID=A0A378QJP0_MORLA|nr:hypothetical protein [Moraxella lacunata]STZ00524.1 Uncharacterised protein [Moraxella lacunata]
MPHHTDTIADWLVSNRLYEDNLFYYALIICFWFFIGFAFLGFELEGFSLQQNLFFNFVFYLFICTMMALCPFWFKFFFSKTHTAKREQELNAHLNELDDDDRQEVVAYLNETGQLAMRPAQRWALVFLGSYFLFEVFFISAWVKDMALVWEPRWASVLIEWVRENTDFLSDKERIDRKLFSVYIKPSDTELYQLYTSEREFLASSFGGATALFQVFRSFCFPLILFAFATIIWRPLDWLGGLSIDPRNIHSVGSFIFSSVATLAMTLLFLSVIFYFIFLDMSAVLLFDKQHWANSFSWNFAFVFAILAIKFIYGWFLFWRDMLFHR